MSRRLVPGIGWLLVCCCAAAWAEPRPQIQVTAKRRTDSAGNGSGYQYYKSKEQRQALQITVRNLDRTPRECQVAWYFTARPAGGGQRFVYDTGESTHALTAGSFTNVDVTSSSLRSTKAQYYGDGRTRQTGSEAEGYFIVVCVDGQAVATTASTRPLQQLAADGDKRQQLIDAARKADEPGVFLR